MVESLEFNFEDVEHCYRNGAGIVRPSVTQSLAAQGIFDFSGVKPDVLENARRRGKNVHAWTAEIDRYGWIDDTWIAEDEMGYFEAWLKLRRELKPRFIAIEKPLMGLIAGIEVPGTPDRQLWIGGSQYVLDLKCCSAKHPGWALQTADYEMLLTGKARCGHMGRMSTQLFPDGRYAVTGYEDSRDADVGIAAIALTAWDDQEAAQLMDATYAAETLNAWKQNNGLLKAA